MNKIKIKETDMDNYKVSVIVPVYNAGHFLKRCVDSILACAYADFELLLIDDGSTDNSGSICDSYAAKNASVRAVHKENGGGKFCPQSWT